MRGGAANDSQDDKNQMFLGDWCYACLKLLTIPSVGEGWMFVCV